MSTSSRDETGSSTLVRKTELQSSSEVHIYTQVLNSKQPGETKRAKVFSLGGLLSRDTQYAFRLVICNQPAAALAPLQCVQVPVNDHLVM